MAPLFVEESCMMCHAAQGYKVGDVRGGISVQYDIDDTEKMLRVNNNMILALGTIILLLLLSIIWFLVYKLMKKHNRAQKKIKEMAITDELTGLYNRRYLYIHLSEEIKRAERFKRPLGCIMIDIDHFKNVNDTYGHNAGDIVLKKISDTIRESCREIDMVARYGGEEIVILSPELSLDSLKTFAERIRKAVNNLRIEVDGKKGLEVTISLGVSSLTTGQLKQLGDKEQIIAFADKALYFAKRNGRNRVEAYYEAVKWDDVL
jgi:diguanylate cyclase (GGDEF)-like protein